ncbi:unnamed protein product [Gongylonema pulchrum]|uniref:Secreted protein n=1 Tax=Gongylonema pulchrum TaxID=637853 RepID=A0A3P6QUU6_9BILA|nr:unnamed protein product [Gongylonema pulchrum]
MIIMIVVLNGLLPRVCRPLFTPSGCETVHSGFDEPRAMVHNVPPGFESPSPSPSPSPSTPAMAAAPITTRPNTI